MDDGIVCPNPRCGADKPGDFRKRGSYENLTGEVDRLGCRVCGLVFSPRTRPSGSEAEISRHIRYY